MTLRQLLRYLDLWRNDMNNKNRPIVASNNRKGFKRSVITHGMEVYYAKHNGEKIFEKTIDKELSYFILKTEEDFDKLLELRGQLENKFLYLKNPTYQRLITAQHKYITTFKSEAKDYTSHKIKQLFKLPTEYDLRKYKKSAKRLLRLMTTIFNSCKKNHFPEEIFSSELKLHSITMRRLNEINGTVQTT